MLKALSAFLAFSVSALCLYPTFSEPIPVSVTEVSAKLLVTKADGSEIEIPFAWTDSVGSKLQEASIALSPKEFELNSTYRIEVTTSTSWIPTVLHERVENQSWTTVAIAPSREIPNPTPGTTQTTQIFLPHEAGFGIKEGVVILVLPAQAEGGFLGLRYRGVQLSEGILTGNGNNPLPQKSDSGGHQYLGAESTGAKGCGMIGGSNGAGAQSQSSLLLLFLVCSSCILALALEHRRNDNKT